MRTAIGADPGDPEDEAWRLLAALWTRGWVTLSQLAAAWKTAVGDRISLRTVLLYERLVTPEQIAEAERSSVAVDPQLLRQVVRETAARPKLISVSVFQLLRQRAGDTITDYAASLLHEGLTSERAVLTAKAMLRSMSAVDLTEIEPDAAALKYVAASVAREHQLLPTRIRWEQETPVLVLAVGDPDCIRAVDAAREAAGIKIMPVLADTSALAAITRHYPEG